MSINPGTLYTLPGDGPYLSLKLGLSDVFFNVPQNRTLCSGRAKSFLKGKGYVTWCEDQRCGLICGSRFAEGVGSVGCPFGHVENTENDDYKKMFSIMKSNHGELFIKKESPAKHDIISEFDNNITMIESESTLSEFVTVIITTSPTQSNPETDLLEAVYSTFSKIPGLDQCHLIICCDGYDNVENTDCTKHKLGFKRGCINSESAIDYEQYKDNLRSGLVKRREDKGLKTTLLDFDNKRQGFGWAVRLALAGYVRTKYTMVIQHDRYFETHFDLLKFLVKVVDPEPETYGVVYFQNQSLMGHIEKIRNRVCNFSNTTDTWSHPLFQPRHFNNGEYSLLPCLAWLDSTHVALSTHLIRFLFGRKGIAAESGVPIKKGCFPEDCINQVQISALKREGPSCHKRFKTWFINQPEEPQVRHLSGRVFKSDGTSGKRARDILKDQDKGDG